MTSQDERLAQAVQDGDVISVRELLSHNANVNFEDKNGKTPLYWAALHNHVEIAVLLLDYQALVNEADLVSMTATVNFLMF
ncbi:hypothetical protein AC1031_013994 [Aphanomyces cochlioides]|nr:hypothetical protein AC1031_013994 [Aphanomyces cochlioides]